MKRVGKQQRFKPFTLSGRTTQGRPFAIIVDENETSVGIEYDPTGFESDRTFILEVPYDVGLTLVKSWKTLPSPAKLRKLGFEEW